MTEKPQCAECKKQSQEMLCKSCAKSMDYSWWRGPFGVRVPNHIWQVPDQDGTNSLENDGTPTKMVADGPEYSEEEYKKKYCYKDRKGKWWFDARVLEEAQTTSAIVSKNGEGETE